MLLENFYTILKSDSPVEQSFITTVKIRKNHSIFKGHFPKYPVTPGVAMLQILKDLTENHCHQSLFLESASHVKFLNLVDPNFNDILKFDIAFQEDLQHIKVKNVTSFEDGTTVLKCNVTFAKR